MHASRSAAARGVSVRLGYALVALLSVAALGLSGYAYLTLDDLRGDISTTDALDSVPGAPSSDDDAVDILLVGNDTRTDAKGRPLSDEMLTELRTEHKEGIRTDTIIILRMPRDGSAPSAVSLPRDSWVDVPHGGKGKINSAFNEAKQDEISRLRAAGETDRSRLELDSDQAGRQALVQTVQDFTGIHVDHYAEVSLLGFYLLTEALGGVEICLNQPTSDPDAGADFAAGRQEVSGADALAFVRQRKNLPRGDLDRITRQQTFLGSALHKVLSAGTLSDRSKLSDLTDAVHRSIVLDPDLDIVEFADTARGIASGDVEFVTIPIEDVDAESDDGQSIVTVDNEEVRSFIAGLVDGSSDDEDGGGADDADGSGNGGADDADGSGNGGGNAVGSSSGNGGGNTVGSSSGNGGGNTVGSSAALAQQDGPDPDEPITGGTAPCVN